MSWKGYETFRVSTSKHKQKKIKLPTLQEAIRISPAYTKSDTIHTTSGIYRVTTLRKMNNEL